VFFSPGDEAAFFHWLESIESVKTIKGYGSFLEVELTTPVHRDAFYELVSLCRRYGVDMRPLSVLETSENSDWARKLFPHMFES
jgi:hypothetical protein